MTLNNNPTRRDWRQQTKFSCGSGGGESLLRYYVERENVHSDPIYHKLF